MPERPTLLQIIRPSARARGGPNDAEGRNPAASSAAHPSIGSQAGPYDGEERCDVCGAPIDAAHDHVVDLRARALLCACRPCHLLFTHEGAGGGRLRAVPQRFLLLPAIAGAREQVEGLDLPIGLAFFFRSSATGRVTAFYPSPAGATESELTLEAWDALVRVVPDLDTVVTDVEAVLIRRREDGLEGFIVPIDASYELVGRIRRSWRGFQGGDDVWREIDDFFARTTARARGTVVA